MHMKLIYFALTVVGSYAWANDVYEGRQFNNEAARNAQHSAWVEEQSNEIKLRIHELFAQMAARHGGISSEDMEIVLAGASFMQANSRFGFTTVDGLACHTYFYELDPTRNYHTSVGLFGSNCFDDQNRHWYIGPTGKLSPANYRAD
jgi:hypothetical protein